MRPWTTPNELPAPLIEPEFDTSSQRRFQYDCLEIGGKIDFKIEGLSTRLSARGMGRSSTGPWVVS